MAHEHLTARGVGTDRRDEGEHRGAAAEHRHRLLAAFVLIGGFFVVELVAGLFTNSLALLSDAGHMLTDTLGLGMALAAIQAATRHDGNGTRTFGLYRLEILAALANAVLLFGVALWILFEAVQRLSAPPQVLSTPMLVVAVIGLGVNLGAFWLLREGSRESLNVEGAYLEVMADTLGSIGVIVAAVLIETTGFALVDPIFGVAIGMFVLPRTWRLGRKAIRILVQAAPPEVDLEHLRGHLMELSGVASVHDLHVWTLTSGMEVASVHLRLAEGTDGHRILDAAQRCLRDDHGIAHATVQIEPPEHGECSNCEERSW